MSASGARSRMGLAPCGGQQEVFKGEATVRAAAPVKVPQLQQRASCNLQTCSAAGRGQGPGGARAPAGRPHRGFFQRGFLGVGSTCTYHGTKPILQLQRGRAGARQGLRLEAGGRGVSTGESQPRGGPGRFLANFSNSSLQLSNQ